MQTDSRKAAKRKILVFAHVPPPVHGQSVMVQSMLDGLWADSRFEVHHVDARVSDDLQDIGSFRPQKFIRLFKCILQAWWIRLRYGRMAFYYVPAPAKRSAIMRDWVVMVLCRPLFPELILHWHAYGLGEWVSEGSDWQRRLTRRALGETDLSIVLNNYNKRDAEVFAPERIEVVPNGIADLFPDYGTTLAPKRKARAAMLKALSDQETKGPRDEKIDRLQSLAEGNVGKPESVRFLFLGHLIESKGVFVAIEATRLANEELRCAKAGWRAHLTLAGGFVSEEEKIRVEKAAAAANQSSVDEMPCIELAGFLDSGQKKSALERADCLVFPTFYENEAQPLVLLEAMSAGLPVITTSWRGVPEILPEGYAAVVEPRSAEKLAKAMLDGGWCGWSESLRRHFRSCFAVSEHVRKLRIALRNQRQ